jgi:uncharacterized protein DUF4429
METISAAGTDGEASFDGGWLTLTRKGWRAELRSKTVRDMITNQGDRRIPARSVTAVSFKPAHHPGARGHIGFTVAGGEDAGLTFTMAQTQAFQALRAAVENAIAGQ